ncbi:hypothetical protein CEXT_708601 [Caerostris extrusa]|uniref:Uncharacterized protein n=1 Tax=Caerostris extrusa TaxID=172846 RepID=A0AAV4Q2H4_CAEEX|nr:hypothetical protein CEXT_708601 [Caerostris extrusa]
MENLFDSISWRIRAVIIANRSDCSALSEIPIDLVIKHPANRNEVGRSPNSSTDQNCSWNISELIKGKENSTKKRGLGCPEALQVQKPDLNNLSVVRPSFTSKWSHTSTIPICCRR